MSIDTVEKRQAALLNAWVLLPDGTISQFDRQALLGGYLSATVAVDYAETFSLNAYVHPSLSLVGYVHQSVTFNAYVYQTKTADLELR